MSAIIAGDVLWRIGSDNSGLVSGMKKATRVVAAGATAAAGSILALAKSSITAYADIGDEIGKMAKRTGLSTEELSRLRNAAELSDASLADLGKGMKNVARVLLDAGRGGESSVRTLNELGLSAKDFAGLNSDQTLDKFMRAIAGIENPLQRSALAAEVFGAKVGAGLLPMLADGYDGFKKMKDATREVFSKEDTDAAEAYNDIWTELGKAFESVQMAIARALLPTLQAAMEHVVGYVDIARGWMSENQALVATIIKVAVVMSAFLALIGPGVILATFGPIIGQVALVVAGLAALGYGIYQLIGGWEGLKTWAGYVAQVMTSMKDWLLANWDQIVRIFELGKNITMQILGIWWEGLKLAFTIIGDVIGLFVKGFADEFLNMEDDADGSTGSVLDTMERFATALEKKLTRIKLDIQKFILDVRSYWDPFIAYMNAIPGGPGALFNAGTSTLFPGSGFIPGLATGGTVQRDGWAMVGERGPELVNLGKGATVYDAQQTATAQRGGGGDSINLTLNFGRDSVRSDSDVRMIEHSLTRALETGLRAAGRSV